MHVSKGQLVLKGKKKNLESISQMLIGANILGVKSEMYYSSTTHSNLQGPKQY